jgi:predicted nucleic acid-binding protein
MIMLDTSVLIAALTRDRPLLPDLRRLLDRGDKLCFSVIVLYEWLRGPRLPDELASQETLFPAETALPFEAIDARISAEIYRAVKTPRGRELDLAIAASAIRHEAGLWTANPAGFADIPRLKLVGP